MVLYVKDKTGRFAERPHYKQEELDQECEKIIRTYLQEKHSEVRFPVDTEDLKSLIERDTHELDCYADLSEHGADVEGVTEFFMGKKPIVRISSRLTEDVRLENRLRTTLTHEYGHVNFHAYLFRLNQTQGQLFQAQAPQRLISKRENIIDAPQSDWMEWQAGYVCGAILMPVTFIRKLATDFVTSRNHFGPISPQSEKGREIIDLVVREFRVSQDAARVRLLKLGILGHEQGPSLFS
jgi:hypothetical protein